MNFLKLLIKAGLVHLKKKDITKAIKKEDFIFLNYAYTNGLYQIRLEIVRELASIDNKNRIPILEKAIDDKIPVISMMAIEALVTYPTPEILQKIQERLEFWEIETRKKNYQKKHRRKPNAYPWNNSRMRELKQEAMKNMKSFGERSAYL